MEIEISITNQELILIDDNGVIKIYKISSSKFGEGSKENSFKQNSDKRKDDESNLLEDSCQVVINYHRSDSRGCIFLGKDWSVSPEDELLRNLRFEYGDDHVELDYKKTTSLT